MARVAGRSREATEAFWSQYTGGLGGLLCGHKTILHEHITQNPVFKDSGCRIPGFTLISVRSSKALP